MNRRICFCLAAALLFVFGSVAAVSAYQAISPKDAMERVENDESNKTYILDIRTAAEYFWMGHPYICDL